MSTAKTGFMKGKWALSSDPSTEVRVLCTDRNHKRSVLSMSLTTGFVHAHNANGESPSGNLIPLVERACAYAVSREDKMMPWTMRATRFEAEALMNGFTQNNNLRCYAVIKLEQVNEIS